MTMLTSFIAFISPGSGEFLLIMLVLILLFGAKDAPRIFRSIHNTLDKIQRAAADFRYKIMYGDLHQGTTTDDPYDVDAETTDEDFDNGFHCEPEEEGQESESREQGSESSEPDEGTPKLRSETEA